jgi:hypothetical protein
VSYDKQAVLERASTQELLSWRNSAYRCHSRVFNHNPKPKDFDNYGYDPITDGESEIPLSMILAELSTREHVPNKAERAELRRSKQKEKQNR